VCRSITTRTSETQSMNGKRRGDVFPNMPVRRVEAAD
jgi:hypothetical protein